MEESEYAGDDRAFRINFAGEGAAKLQETVREKLREFLGDYTDDTLVEYVIVLLKNGRLKEEAKRELNVFLGDESDSFVSWLWDHLSLNMHTYVQPIEPLTEEAANRTTTANAHFGKLNSEVEPVVVFEHDDEKSVNASRSRRNREWKGIVSEMSGSFPLRSTVIEALHSGEKTSQRSDASHKSQVSKKRNREDERQPTKGDAESLPKLAPPRRLLEFALRDAVKTVQQSSSKIEPVVKRLRSVVSTSMEALLDERSQRPRSTIRTPSSTLVALKAAAEAAENVTKSSSVGSVFDRLGRGQPTVEPMNQSSYIKRTFLQDAKDEKFDQIIRPVQVDYSQKNDYGGDLTGNSSILNSVADIDADSTSDNDGYDDFGISSDHGLDASEYAYSANKRESSLMLHYNVSKDTDAVVNKTKLIQQETPPNALAKPSNKIVNISVNVNTWKPDDYQVVETGNQTTLKPNARVLKDNPSSIVGNEKEMASTDIQKDSQKSQVQVSTLGISYTTSRPSEDVESRTIFVSNVHFAATKDTLSRHFNKFGEVLKVIIVTDPASGQPIGSAYVEFLRKESAELALSLNGTSFMSRILKVVRRSSAEAHAIGWARNGRPPPFASRLGRMAFPRGVIPGAGSGGAFRARLALKHGARSLQWKRGAAAPQTSGVTLQNAVPATPRIAGRNLTYVRPDKA